ncbi:MAG: hypothetical protein UV82_C0009G0079 [Candidatus Magasanikbacteria bacterium GW2011_GWD2_43_18]|nr:MAG: hypothetical protein UV18_C0004G0162 [Candidatus Magasanikbacteria bacterium GW2011_GWC2_42_27]KKT04339.1 MAG: hypothetical protein UV82_C0009G0079 [Candidatus Magasanikbacteria bacterium GW2011_GWD2_43_18]KKT25335.1 MAG: hypothetical protein UW10_C0009G0018 [Candidatus Magasanikbacteria bacterium GW2011_GWA2_43_9]HBB38045.1 DUF1428 domain-containing protein [Candidatus Magasanikbacteria bacterium]HCC13980.1 DUF1428 domain-containing protein [Candidatus Magasanikbacteria bacterium]
MPKNTTRYVDGFVLVVPKKNVEAYKKMAKIGAKVWLKYGALDYKECMLDDKKPKFVTFTFPIMTKAKPSETIWFSFITYRSKKHRDQVNAKVMNDPSMQPDGMKDMPFDMKRMAFGGFTVEVSS